MKLSRNFEQISESPRATSDDGRQPTHDSGVLLAATELFIGRTKHTLEDKKIFLELAENLLPATSLKDRRRISILLSASFETPDNLLAQLAGDPDDLTAYPALRYSPRLSVDLLVRTARFGPETLRKAIANRPSLHESVLTELFEHSSSNVIQILLDRDDVTMSEKHQTILSRRQDIVATLGLELAGWNALNPEGLLGQFVHLPQALKAKALASAEMTNLIRQAQSPESPKDARLVSAHLKLQDALVQAALAKDTAEFTDTLSQGLGLSTAFCDHLLHQDQGDALTVALKTLGMNTANTTKILIRFLGEKLILREIKDLLRLHRTLSTGAAELLVGQWILHSDLSSHKGTSPDQSSPQYQDAPRQVESNTEPAAVDQEKSIRRSINET
ncbi:MAG: DUF2336 domain-containing protein [Roseibium sp.]